MRLKFMLILAVLILSFGFTSTSGINTVVNSLKIVEQIKTDNSGNFKETELVLENGSVMHCSFQAKRTTVRSLGNKGLDISINSNWNCK